MSPSAVILSLSLREVLSMKSLQCSFHHGPQIPMKMFSGLVWFMFCSSEIPLGIGRILLCPVHSLLLNASSFSQKQSSDDESWSFQMSSSYFVPPPGIKNYGGFSMCVILF